MNTLATAIAIGVIALIALVAYIRHRKEQKHHSSDSVDVLAEMLRETEKLGEDEFLRKKLELPSGRRISDMELLQLTKRDIKAMSQEDVACIANYSCNQSLNKKPQFDGLYMMAYDALKR